MLRAELFDLTRGLKRLAWVSVGLISACAASQGAQQSGPRMGASASKVSLSDEGPFRAQQILAILEKSKIQYEIILDDSVEPTAIADVLPATEGRVRQIDPFLEVTHVGPKKRPRLVLSRPPLEVAKLFEQAQQAFLAKRFEIAGALYAKAVQKRPDYFKSYTFLGNAFYLLGELNRAERAFMRATELNPLDYQAHLFLGDTYREMGEISRAKASLTRAFMLNRTNPVIKDRLRAVLAQQRLSIRDQRLAPRVKIVRKSKERVEIRLHKEDKARWLTLASCMACWAFEGECNQRSTEEEDPLRLMMHRECLVNQVATIAARSQSGGGLSASERQLLEAVEAGYLEAIVFWEVMAQRAPVVVLLLPKPLQERIVQYINRYVFRSTQIVRLGLTTPGRT